MNLAKQTAKQIETIARMCHTLNRIYCESLGDFSQPRWDVAPAWQRESAIAGVRAILNGEVTHPAESHESWLRHKRAEGWRYGPVKDPAKKLHPCMVPFDRLPAEQQRKDHLFFSTVVAMARPLAGGDRPSDGSLTILDAG